MAPTESSETTVSVSKLEVELCKIQRFHAAHGAVILMHPQESSISLPTGVRHGYMTRESSDGEQSLPMITRRSALTATAGGMLGATMASTTVTAQQDSIKIWTFEIDDSGFLSPTVGDESVFIGDWDGTYYAVDAITGEQKWEFKISTQGTSPTVADSTLFIGGGDNTLYAIDTESGEQQWKKSSFRNELTRPAVSNGTVFVGNRNGLFALDAATGEQKWFYRTFAESSPTVTNGTVFVGNWEPNIHAVDATTGEERWVFKDDNFQNNFSNGNLPLSPFRSPVASDNTIFGTVNASLYAINIETGNQRWTYQSESSILSPPTISDDRVLVGNDKIHAVDTETGEQQWTFEPDVDISPYISLPAMDNDTVYIGAYNVYALNAGTGEKLWSIEIDGKLSSPSVVDDTIFVGSEEGKLFSFDTKAPPKTDTSADSGVSGLSNITLSGVVGGVVVGPIFGYGLYRLIGRRRSVTESANTKSRDTTESGTSTDSKPTQNVEENQSPAEEYRTEAETAIETAATAKSNANFDTAADAYREAINKYQAAIDSLEAGATEKRAEVEGVIDSTRSDLESVNTLHEQRREVIEALQPAERSLQEAIVAYIENDQTVARIRFRQARDTFEDAHETITESEDDLFTDPVAVDVQPDRKPTSTTLSELSVIPEAAATELTEAGIETIDNLDSSAESPWRPAAVEELVANGAIEEDTATALTLLSWWHGDESYEFDTAEAVARRQQQADYGFNHTS